MKSILLFLFSVGTALSIAAQKEPDLSKLKNIGDKITTWHEYCNSLLGQTQNEKIFPKLAAAAKIGIALAPQDSLRAKAMFSLFAGVAYENMRHYDTAEVYLTYALEQAKKIQHQNYAVLALTRLDNIYSYTNSTEKRQQVIATLKAIGDTTSNQNTKRELYSMLGGYYRDINNYDSSVSYRLQHIDTYKKQIEEGTATDTMNLAYAYTNLGNLFNEIGRYNKALEYLYEGADIIGNRALTGNEETLYLYFMDAYAGLKNTDSLLKYYRLIVTKMAHRDTLYNVLSRANYFLGNYYHKLNKPENAYYFASLAYQLSKKNPNADVRIVANTLYADLLSQRKQYNDALSILNSTLKEDFSFDKQLLANIHQTISNCYAGLNRWDSAYAYYKLYSEANADILEASGEKNIADAEAVYQNREKRLQIEAKNILLQNASRQRLWLMAGLSLLALIALLLFIIYRNKKKTASKLDEKNKALVFLNQQLDEANNSKAKLFSIISHDLRSPINQVHQFLRLQQLNPDALTAEQKASLNNKIQTATGSLLETMEDLLLWSKTQMNEFKASIQRVNVTETVQDIVKLLQLSIDAKKIHVDNQIPTEIITDTDPNYLQTIIRNLLQNAVKASPENGRVVILADTRSISISNEGVPFTQEQYETIIQNNDIAKGLTGLGLKLTDELSKKINASLHFSSSTTGFTTVTVRFA